MKATVLKPAWLPLRRAGSAGGEVRILLQRHRTVLANLRFAEHATIDEHSAPFDVDVFCLAGSGFVSVGKEATPLSGGELISWPAGVNHRLWTEGSRMETLMVEHRDS